MAAPTSAFDTFVQGLQYRGKEGHYAFILHRVSGMAILAFLVIHIIDTSWVYFWPEGYMHAIELYRSVPFLLSEYALMAAIIYHAVNGLNIIVKDTFPSWWNKHLQSGSFWKVMGLSAVLWLFPAFFITRSLYNYHLCPALGNADCGSGQPTVSGDMLGIAYPIIFVVALVALGVLAYGGTQNTNLLTNAPRYISKPGKNFETWSWLFMRWSGGLLFIIVWVHVLSNALLTGAHYIDLEYVAQRWAEPISFATTFSLLMFALLHGMNGLRAIIGDYVHNEPVRRFLGVFMMVLWVVTTALGAIAMFGGVRA